MRAGKDLFFHGEFMPLDVEDVVIVPIEPRNNQTTMVAYCIYNSLLDKMWTPFRRYTRRRMDYGQYRQTSLRRSRDSRWFVRETGYHERPLDSSRDGPRFEHGVLLTARS